MFDWNEAVSYGKQCVLLCIYLNEVICACLQQGVMNNVYDHYII